MDSLNWDPFDQLTAGQREKLKDFQEQLLRFNQRVNLISSESERAFRKQHLLHCLTLTVRDFPDGCTIVDWGTGGGLPAVPLAICEPAATVVGVDSVGKKARAVRTMARRLGLENAYAWAGRAEHWDGTAHYSVSRATAPLANLWRWHRRVVVPLEPTPGDNAWPPGLLALKGGDLSDEIADLRADDPDVMVERYPLGALLGRNGFFGEKEIVSVRSGESHVRR
jgi:16S rRNA (guanine527-N7)-methyltransferase